jgi:hypothetical protein
MCYYHFQCGILFCPVKGGRRFLRINAFKWLLTLGSPSLDDGNRTSFPKYGVLRINVDN